MDEKNVSVIVPVYNKEKELVRCVESLMNQTLDGIEIIVIDDGSTDHSPQLCDELKQKYSNMSVLHIKNGGLGNARNKGIGAAAGKYIAFVDSDDYIENENYLKTLFETSERLALDLCFAGRMVKVSKRSRQVGKIASDNIVNKLISEPSEIERLKPALIGRNGGQLFLSNSACAALYRREIIVSEGICFKNEKEYISEDLIFNIDFMEHTRRLYVENVEGYCYWYNSESLSRSYNKDRFFLLSHMLVYLEERFPEKSFDVEARISLYFWRNFEKCMNQEVRYFKNREMKDTVRELQILCEDRAVKKYVGFINENKLLRGLHKYLCGYVNDGNYVIIVLLLKLYNALKEGTR